MMATIENFDASAIEPGVGFTPIPAGRYTAVIAESSEHATKSGNGEYLKLQIQIVDDGPSKGRVIFVNLNLKNPNPQAVAFARSELSAICRATGVITPRDSVELHNIPFFIDVACKRDKDGNVNNHITSYTHRNANGQVASAAAAPTNEKAPWQKS